MNSTETLPLVTVCIPSYNHARFVGETIQSIIDQTYTNVELIIIDDGSADKSVSVIEDFREVCERRFERFEVRTRPNKGLAATLNEALAWGRGEYFSAIASDDVALPTKLDTLVNELASHENWAGIFAGVELIDDDGVTHGLRSRSGEWVFDDIFLAKVQLMAPTAVLRASVLKSIGGFESSTIIEDWPTWLKITEAGEYKLGSVSHIVAKYRLHGSNTHKRVEDMHNAKVTIIKNYSSHPNASRALASACATSAIALAGTSKSKSLMYLCRSRGAPEVAILHAVAKLILPASLFSFARQFLGSR